MATHRCNQYISQIIQFRKRELLKIKYNSLTLIQYQLKKQLDSNVHTGCVHATQTPSSPLTPSNPRTSQQTHCVVCCHETTQDVWIYPTAFFPLLVLTTATKEVVLAFSLPVFSCFPTKEILKCNDRIVVSTAQTFSGGLPPHTRTHWAPIWLKGEGGT